MTLVVTAARVVRKRVGAHQALADLRHGRLLIESGEFRPFAPPTVSTAASEMFRTADGAQCQAASSSQQAQLSVGPVPGRRTRPDARCVAQRCGRPQPGTNLLPRTERHRRVRAARRACERIGGSWQLLLGRSVVSLTRPGSFAGLGYVGTRSGALRFSSTLEHVQAPDHRVAHDRAGVGAVKRVCIVLVVLALAALAGPAEAQVTSVVQVFGVPTVPGETVVSQLTTRCPTAGRARGQLPWGRRGRLRHLRRLRVFGDDRGPTARTARSRSSASGNSGRIRHLVLLDLTSNPGPT